MIVTLNIAVSWGLFLLIWLVQIIVYPSFRNIPDDAFTRYHRWYAIRISAFVMPLMLAEVWLIYNFAVTYYLDHTVLLCGLMIVLVWLSTIFIQVPIHKKLSAQKNMALIERLVKTNWLRTFGWSVKAILVTFVLARQLP